MIALIARHLWVKAAYRECFLYLVRWPFLWNESLTPVAMKSRSVAPQTIVEHYGVTWRRITIHPRLRIPTWSFLALSTTSSGYTGEKSWKVQLESSRVWRLEPFAWIALDAGIPVGFKLLSSKRKLENTGSCILENLLTIFASTLLCLRSVGKFESRLASVRRSVFTEGHLKSTVSCFNIGVSQVFA